MVQPSNPRRANGHRRNQVRTKVLREEHDCWLCGQPVDKTLPPHQDGSPEIDEIIPVSLGGSPIDRRNCHLAHRICNIRRGNGTKTKPIVEPVNTRRSWSFAPDLGGSPLATPAGPPPA